MNLIEKISSVQSNINDILSGSLSFASLGDLVFHDSALIRVNAIAQIGKQFPSLETITILEKAALDPRNTVCLMGRKIANFAIESMILTGHADAVNVVHQLIATYSPVELQDLIDHFRLQGLQLPSCVNLSV